MNTEKLKNWFNDLIIRFRELYNNLSQDEKKRIYSLENLNAPLQLNIFWFQNPVFNIDYQIIFFTRWKDFKDLSIEVHGPIKFSKCANSIENILSNGKWNRIVSTSLTFWPSGTKLKYRDYLENLFYNNFSNFKRNFLNWLFRDNDKPFYSAEESFTNECFQWICYGNISKANIDDIINRIIQNARRKRNQKQLKNVELKPKPIKGYGCYIYPPIWLGKFPEFSLQEKLFGARYHSHDREFLNIIYKGKYLIIEKDGYIAIGVDDKKKARNMLNEIMAIAQFFELPFYTIREPDLGDVRIDPENQKIQSMSMMGKTIRTELLQDRWEDLSQINLKSRIEVSAKVLKKIAKFSEILTVNKQISNLLRLFLEAKTYFLNFEYSQSILMSWILIESKIESEWNKIIENKITNLSHLRKLKKNKFHTIDDKIEILNLTERLSEEEYDLFINLKKVRNKIVHNGVNATKEKAEDAIKICSNIIKEIIGINDK